MPRLIVNPGTPQQWEIQLQSGLNTFGRGPDNQCVIDHPSVSTAHCQIVVEDGSVRLKDLGSTNGTFINGQQITEATLKPSQILRLGQVEVRLESDQASSAQKKMTLDHTQVVPQGIKFEELGQLAKSGNPGFEKKSNTGTKIFITIAIVAGILILAALAWVLFGGGQ